MKTNPENIPAYIFDWIDQHPFHNLSEAQQQEALQYISMEEYDALYNSGAGIKSHIAKQAQSKEKLLNYFDLQNKGEAGILTISRIGLWKAASVFLFGAILLLSYLLLNGHKQLDAGVLTIHDTIMIEKPAVVRTAGPEVLLPQKVKPMQKPEVERVVKSRPDKKVQDTGTQKLKYRSDDGIEKNAMAQSIPVLSIDKMHTPGNSSKRNSRKDDSLERNFQFVSM